MNDNLEKFIRTNREAFDQSQPDLKVWAGIDQALERRKKNRRIPLWRSFAAAASIALLIGMGTLIGLQMNKGNTNIAAISPELEEMREYYETTLQEKTALLASFDTDKEVTEDLQQLDLFLNELKAELREAPKGGEEKIVNAMIENYQDRLEILERVLSRIQSNNKHSQKLNNNEEINL